VPVDLSPYNVVGGEKPASSAKQNSTIQAIQDALNSIPPAAINGYPGAASVYLDGSGHWSAPPVSSSPITVLGKWTSTTASGGAGYVELLGLTIPAGKLTTQGAIKLWAGGTYLHGGGTSWQVAMQLGLGGLVVWNSGAQTINVTATGNRRAWWFRAVLQAYGTLSNTHAGGYFGVAWPAAAVAGGHLSDMGTVSSTNKISNAFYGAGVAADMTLAQPLGLAVQVAGGTGTATMTLDYARVEVS
jgi:hypothetical protein